MARNNPRRYFDAEPSPSEQEERVAKRVRGKRQPGSGSSMFAKGDVDSEHFLYECKQTGAESIRITKKWLDKISHEANAVQKYPALEFEIYGGVADPISSRKWVAIPFHVFEKFVAHLGSREEEE